MERLISLLAFTLLVSSASAQFSYGIKGGASLTGMNVMHPGVVNDQYRLSYHFGLYGVYYIGEQISLSPELLLSNKGFQAQAQAPSSVPGGGLEEFSLSLGYLSLPVLVGYHPWKSFSVHLGPELSYRLASKIAYDAGSNDAGVVWDRRPDVGAIAGLSYLVGDKIDVTFRYIHGLINVVSQNFIAVDANDPLITEQQSKNRVFQLSVGYRLN